MVFDRRTAFFIVLCCLPLLFFPKINLLSLSKSETAGIRFDDVVLLVLCVFLFWAHVTVEKGMSSIERWVMAFVLWSLVSFATNRVFVAFGLIPASSSIFYCLRMLEYFIFFYIGALSAPILSTGTVIKLFFVWNAFLMILQKLAIVGQFTSSGYVAIANDRVAGIGSFPSETGMLLIMVFAYMLFVEKEKVSGGWTVFPAVTRLYRFTRIYLLFFVFAVLIALTGARIALAALVVIFVFRIVAEIRTGSTASRALAIFSFTFGILIIGLAVQHATSLIERSAGLVSWRNVELITKTWDRVDVSQSQDMQNEVKFEKYDMSWWMRIHKWAYALKMYVMHPITYLQGVGPGFATPALDGGLLRILTETGVIGCVIFAGLLRSIGRLSEPLKWMVVGFLLNMIFFDVYLAYKPMSLLFFTAGSTFAAAKKMSVQPKDLNVYYSDKRLV
jgi:hypothetical protein